MIYFHFYFYRVLGIRLKGITKLTCQNMSWLMMMLMESAAYCVTGLFILLFSANFKYCVLTKLYAYNWIDFWYNSSAAGDWVNCGICGEWAHFGCDRRQGLGAFKVSYNPHQHSSLIKLVNNFFFIQETDEILLLSCGRQLFGEIKCTT